MAPFESDIFAKRKLKQIARTLYRPNSHKSLLITRSQINETEHNFQSPKRLNTSRKKGQPERKKHKTFAPQKKENKSIEKEKKKYPKTSNEIIDLIKKKNNNNTHP